MSLKSPNWVIKMKFYIFLILLEMFKRIMKGDLQDAVLRFITGVVEVRVSDMMMTLQVRQSIRLSLLANLFTTN